jgi:hypothetical protein
MRIIGLDIHRAFAEAVAWQEGKLKRIGRIDMRRDRLETFVATWSTDDVVVVEAPGNAAADQGAGFVEGAQLNLCEALDDCSTLHEKSMARSRRKA